MQIPNGHFEEAGLGRAFCHCIGFVRLEISDQTCGRRKTRARAVHRRTVVAQLNSTWGRVRREGSTVGVTRCGRW
jgi:hypothetical protein